MENWGIVLIQKYHLQGRHRLSYVKKDEFIRFIWMGYLLCSANRKQCAATIFGAPKFTNLLYSVVELLCLCDFSSQHKSIQIYLVSEACKLTLHLYSNTVLQ